MLLGKRQLESLQAAFMHGAADASEALAKWLERPASISVETVVQLPLQEATGILGTEDEPVCFCSVEMTGKLSGELILAFDDASGMLLADILLRQVPGTCDQWNDVATSAALETTNIVGCAYLSSLARFLPSREAGLDELMPSPPTFNRDFAESLVQFALMGQAVESDQVFVARMKFHVDDTPIAGSLLFVPDADSIHHLRNLQVP